MASLTIRNLDQNLKAQLRQQAARRGPQPQLDVGPRARGVGQALDEHPAARHGRSMEAEARTILAQTLNAPVGEQNLAAAIHRRFESLDLESLPIPPRQAVRNPPDFGE